MVKNQDIITYVTKAEQTINAYQTALRKAASANTVKFDESSLLKVASDIHTLYGKPSNIKPEQLAAHWKSDPNSLVGTLQKMASAQLASVASGNHLGAPSNHEVTEVKADVLDADAAFREKYSNR